MTKSKLENVPDDFDTLKPSERFARLAKAVIHVKTSAVITGNHEQPLEPLKRDRKPNQEREQPTI